jgi:chromosome segregation ATPase
MSPSEYQQLIEFLGPRFEAIDRRFDAVDRRFEGIDRRFDGIDHRLDGIDLRLDEVDRRLETADRWARTVDRRFDEIDGRCEAMAPALLAMRAALDTMGAKLDEFRRETLGHFEDIYRRLERLEQEYQMVSQALRRIEMGLTHESGRREALERDLVSLREDVAGLNARIQELERRLTSG